MLLISPINRLYIDDTTEAHSLTYYKICRWALLELNKIHEYLTCYKSSVSVSDLKNIF